MKRIPRKKKKAMKMCVILHSGNPGCRKLSTSKRRWVSAWKGGYGIAAVSLTIQDRREANKVTYNALNEYFIAKRLERKRRERN